MCSPGTSAIQRCELALKGGFEDSLTVDLELLARGGQVLDFFVEFGN